MPLRSRTLRYWTVFVIPSKKPSHSEGRIKDAFLKDKQLPETWAQEHVSTRQREEKKIKLQSVIYWRDEPSMVTDETVFTLHVTRRNSETLALGAGSTSQWNNKASVFFQAACILSRLWNLLSSMQSGYSKSSIIITYRYLRYLWHQSINYLKTFLILWDIIALVSMSQPNHKQKINITWFLVAHSMKQLCFFALNPPVLLAEQTIHAACISQTNHCWFWWKSWNWGSGVFHLPVCSLI